MPVADGHYDQDSIEIDYFKVGDRFRMSTLGAQRCPRLSKKVGTITSMIENSQTVCVRFDGNKRPTTLHRDYIELVASNT
jgi:hypothetical protein